jgi:AraC-like DNA-binding protein
MLAVDELGYERSRVVGHVLEDIEQDIIAGDSTALFNDYLRLLALLEAQQRDKDIGLHLGERMDIKHLGTYGQLLACAGSVEEALELAARYIALVHEAQVCEMITSEGTALFTCYFNGTTTLPMAHDNELTLAAFVSVIRGIAGEDWRPVSVCFQHSRPRHIEEHHRIFCDTLLFDQPKNCLEIQQEVLQRRNRSAEPEVLRDVRKFADEFILQGAESDLVSQKVSAMLLVSLGREELTQQVAAARLNCSRSSLQRKLAAEGASFRQLREQAIYKLACRALEKTDSSISQVALMLGYSQSSAFDRAFRRLSGGFTPSQYRQKKRRQAHSRAIDLDQSFHNMS